MSLNTPLFGANPAVLQKIKDLGLFDYQVYFQKPVSLAVLKLSFWVNCTF